MCQCGKEVLQSVLGNDRRFLVIGELAEQGLERLGFIDRHSKLQERNRRNDLKVVDAMSVLGEIEECCAEITECFDFRNDSPIAVRFHSKEGEQSLIEVVTRDCIVLLNERRKKVINGMFRVAFFANGCVEVHCEIEEHDVLVW